MLIVIVIVLSPFLMQYNVLRHIVLVYIMFSPDLKSFLSLSRFWGDKCLSPPSRAQFFCGIPFVIFPEEECVFSSVFINPFPLVV